MRRTALIVALTLVWAVACGDRGNHEGGPTGESTSAVKGGTPADAEALGMPAVETWGGAGQFWSYAFDGSAVALTNEWVLAARHVASREKYAE